MMGPTSKPATVTKPRPLSPHLTIYAVQYTSTLSILHRLSGGLMCASILAFLCIFQYLVYDWPSFYGSHSFFSLFGLCFTDEFEFAPVIHSWLVLSLVGAFGVGVLLSFYYHFSAGSRHLLFDLGLGFERNRITFSAQSVILLALFLSLTVLVVVFWSSWVTVAYSLVAYFSDLL
jgi:succinate dehydrogenase / fumarate reductase cytochrome b subunit